MDRHRQMVEIVEGSLKKNGYQVIVAPHARKPPYNPEDKEIRLYDKKRDNGGCNLSNADIAIPNNDKSMRFIIEIETDNVPVPKTLIGTIEATNYSQVCYIGQVKDQNVYDIDRDKTILFIILDDKNNISGDPGRKINWIMKEYEFKQRNIRNFKISFLNNFVKMSREDLERS
ncbi:MAG: hypothetical protein KKI07_02725 [Euryarchaeota archaeon]|nr:hypothetical protein [Euryarchaeota archaeon]